MKRLALLAALLIAAPLAALAHGYTLGAIDIDHPHVVAASAKALSTVGYMTLINNGEFDRLLSVTSPGATVTLHRSSVDADGVARMERLEGVDLPAGGMAMFEPGGLHLMFTDLVQAIADGGKVPATLIFEKSGAINIEFNVEMHSAATHSHGSGG